jgi:hypothetical protein
MIKFTGFNVLQGMEQVNKSLIIRPVLLSLEDVMTLPINYYDQGVIAKYFAMKARTPRMKPHIAMVPI